MKITAFNGSPAGKDSATHKMVEEILAGASDAGAQVGNYFLKEKRISHCTACGHCLNIKLNECSIKDDMAELMDQFRQSDIVIYATPLFFDNVSGLMKVFFDRTLSFVAPHVGKDEYGEYRHVDKPGFSNSFYKVPKLVAVSNAAFPEQSHFQAISLLFSRMARNIHTELIAEIYRGEGPLIRLDVPALKPIIDDYKKLLRKAGNELAQSLKLSEETRIALEKPLIPYDAYVNEWNKSIDNHWQNRINGCGP